MTIGAQKVDNILSIGKSYGNTRELGYLDESYTFLTSKTTFIRNSKPTISRNYAQTFTTTMVTKNVMFVPVYHLCGTKGHIRPKCGFLLNATHLLYDSLLSSIYEYYAQQFNYKT